MAPNRYTELFFLDEATGLAAGHRPCFECQRRRYNEFCAAWAAGNLHGPPPVTAGEIDERLHADRLDRPRSKRTFTASLADLPDGVFITHERDGQACHSEVILCSSGLQRAIVSLREGMLVQFRFARPSPPWRRSERVSSRRFIHRRLWCDLQCH